MDLQRHHVQLLQDIAGVLRASFRALHPFPQHISYLRKQKVRCRQRPLLRQHSKRRVSMNLREIPLNYDTCIYINRGHLARSLRSIAVLSLNRLPAKRFRIAKAQMTAVWEEFRVLMREQDG